MKYIAIEKGLKENYKKGAFTTIKTKRPANVRKGFEGLGIEKVTVYDGARLGIEYDNMTQTKRNRLEGVIPAVNAGLKWGEWEDYPLFIRHKGKRYVRFYAQLSKVKSHWTMNGQRVELAEIKGYLLASEYNKKEDKGEHLTLTMKVENIIEIV